MVQAFTRLVSLLVNNSGGALEKKALSAGSRLKSDLACLGTLRDDLYMLPDRIVQIPGTHPTRAHTLKANDPFVVNQDVGGKRPYAKRALYASIVIAVLRPDHLVLGGEFFPLCFIAI